MLQHRARTAHAHARIVRTAPSRRASAPAARAGGVGYFVARALRTRVSMRRAVTLRVCSVRHHLFATPSHECTHPEPARRTPTGSDHAARRCASRLFFFLRRHVVEASSSRRGRVARTRPTYLASASCLARVPNTASFPAPSADGMSVGVFVRRTVRHTNRAAT